MYSRRIDHDLTAQQLRAILDYNEETGVFRWRWRENVPDFVNKRDAGNVAGWVARVSTGHMKVTLNGGSYFLARLAWLYVTGSWPVHEIDHIDNDPGNNRFTNLRDVTHLDNMKNQGVSRSTDGKRMKGARFHKATGRWQASIILEGKSHYIGLFDTPESAHAAYCEAAARLHGEFARFA